MITLTATTEKERNESQQANTHCTGRNPSWLGMSARKTKKVSQVIFASCAAWVGTLSRPEWSRFPHLQVEFLPPCSAKPPKEPALAPDDFRSSPGGRPSLRFPGKTGSRQSEATRRPGAAPPIAASEHPPSPPSPEGSGRSRAPLRRLPLSRSKPIKELARPPLAASPPSRPKPWSRIDRLRPAPPRGQLASTPWDKENFMTFSEPRNQKFHQEFGLFPCGFPLESPIRNCIFN